MSVAVDASSPVRWTATLTHSTSVASASFTAPADSFFVVCANWDGSAAADGPATISDSSSLTWTAQVRRDITETTSGGASGIFTAVASASTSRTITLTHGGTTNTLRYSAKAYVLTGVDIGGTPVDTVGANNEGGSATNSMTTTSLTPGANGLLIAVGTDWNALGAGSTPPTSSDLTKDAASYSGAIDAIAGYKTCSSGVSANANLDAAGTAAAQWKWCQIIVREAAAGAAFIAPPPKVILQAVNRANNY